jgi:PhnB protein
MYIPPGFGTLFPYLLVSDAVGFVAFLKSAFAATELGRTTMSADRIANARIRIGTTSFMVGEAEGRAYPPMPTAFYLYVEDAHASMARAIAAGARQESPVGDMPYGDRQGGVRDPFGNIWWISQRLIHEPYDP